LVEELIERDLAVPISEVELGAMRGDDP